MLKTFIVHEYRGSMWSYEALRRLNRRFFLRLVNRQASVTAPKKVAKK